MEHWKRTTYDQENLTVFYFFKPLWRLQSLYLMRKQQEVNRTDTVGYKNTKENIL